MIATPDETVAPLASALVRAGRAGSGQRIALSNGTASGSVIPLLGRRAFLGSLTGGLLAAPTTTEAQQASKVWRIGLLDYGSPGPARLAWWRAFQDRLRELGYVEGQNVVFQPRWGNGQVSRLQPRSARGQAGDKLYSPSELSAKRLGLPPSGIVRLAGRHSMYGTRRWRLDPWESLCKVLPCVPIPETTMPHS
jgi:hypothetical protein